MWDLNYACKNMQNVRELIIKENNQVSSSLHDLNIATLLHPMNVKLHFGQVITATLGLSLSNIR